MPKKEKKDKSKDDLDTETTIVDMNVEGFRWYDPSKKNDQNKTRKPKVSRKEYWAMVKGAFLAYLPMFIIILLSFALVFLLAYLWLTH
jgi:hypothetical protein